MRSQQNRLINFVSIYYVKSFKFIVKECNLVFTEIRLLVFFKTIVYFLFTYSHFISLTTNVMQDKPRAYRIFYRKHDKIDKFYRQQYLGELKF